MLILTRRVGETVMIGNDVRATRTASPSLQRNSRPRKQRQLRARSRLRDFRHGAGPARQGGPRKPQGAARDPGELSFTFRDSLRIMAAPAPGPVSYFRNPLTRKANHATRRVGRVVEGAPLLRV